MGPKEKEGLAAGPPTVCSGPNCQGKQKIRRVGKLARGPLRSRCPRAAPNPSLENYALALRVTMGPQSHSTGYLGCSTNGPFFQPLTLSQFHLSRSITIRCTENALRIPGSKRRIVLLLIRLNSSFLRTRPSQENPRPDEARLRWVFQSIFHRRVTYQRAHVAIPRRRTTHQIKRTLRIHNLYRVMRHLAGSRLVPAATSMYKPAISAAPPMAACVAASA